jgi:hypothetical protein
MEKITNKIIKFIVLLIFLIANISNSFSQDVFKEVKLIFYKEIVRHPIYIPIYDLNYTYKQDSLFCISDCKQDTTYIDENIIIDECRIIQLEKFKSKKKAITIIVPSKYDNLKILIISYKEFVYYFEADKKKRNTFHLYKLE